MLELICEKDSQKLQQHLTIGAHIAVNKNAQYSHPPKETNNITLLSTLFGIPIRTNYINETNTHTHTQKAPLSLLLSYQSVEATRATTNILTVIRLYNLETTIINIKSIEM